MHLFRQVEHETQLRNKRLRKDNVLNETSLSVSLGGIRYTAKIARISAPETDLVSKAEEKKKSPRADESSRSTTCNIVRTIASLRQEIHPTLSI